MVAGLIVIALAVFLLIVGIKGSQKYVFPFLFGSPS